MTQETQTPDPVRPADGVQAAPRVLQAEAPPRLRTAPPRPVPLLPRPVPTGFGDAYGPALYFALFALIPLVSLALLLYAPTGASFEPLTPEEWAAMMNDPAASASPERAAPATLHVESDPEGSLVYIDFDLGGLTPFRTAEIASGWHTVSLAKSGYASTDTLLYLEPGSTTLLALSLSPLSGVAPGEPPTAPAAAPATAPTAARERPVETGELRIETTPSGVPVRIDGTAAGVTPLLVRDLAPGTHEVGLDLPGYAPQTLRAVVAPGERAAVSAALVALTGTLSVAVHPWGSIYVDGELRARDTDLRHDVEVPAGTRRVRVVHPVLGAQEQRVDVRANQRISVTFDLN